MLPSEFSDLYHRSYPYLQRLVGSVTSGYHATEDTIQEVYLAAWLRFRSTSHPNPFGWLIITARHKACDQLSRQLWDSQHCIPLDEDTFISPGSPSFEDTQIDHLSDLEMPYPRIRRLLSSDELTLLVAFYEEGVSILDLSKRLNISPQACYMRLHRARHKLDPLLTSA